MMASPADLKTSRPPPDQSQTQSARSQSKGAGKEKTKEKTFMDRWVEPPVAAAAPSYQDHGGAPYGVLDGMQALGDLPSAKVKGRVKGDGVRKSVLGRSSAVDAQETPRGSPAPQPPTPQPADLPAPHTIVIDDEKDDDYAPKVNGKKRDRATRNRGSKRVSQPAASVTPAPTPTFTAAQPPRPTAPALMATPTPAPPPVHMHAQPAEYGGDKLKRVVEAAKARAIEVGKPDLAAAVNEIYEQSQTDYNLRTLLQAILSQQATHDQNNKFQDYVRSAKKKLKDAKQRERQQPAVPSANESQPQSQPQPIVNSMPTKLSIHSTPVLPAPGALQAVPSTEPAEPVKGRFSLTVKSPAKHHQRQRPGKGNMSVSPKKRSGSVGSDSSLTDLTSNDGNGDDMDLDDADDLHQGPPPPPAAARVNGIKPKDQATERGALTVPSGGAMKRSSAEAELEQERDRVLAAKKQKLGESIARDYDVMESSVRPAFNAPKSRAQQVKSEALAPRLSLHANGSRTGSARPSRATSVDADSPLSSPAGSRQSTPKVWKTAPKPFGKRAKTKQSPEKKQLGVPGSGALRESPLGDDDNEERSENHDFCSACRGSGYLLCCDGCERSFHFTCLDPPLSGDAKELEEPWFCFVCVSRRPAPLDSPEKGQPLRGIFAPLLGNLKKRNPRNFELPQSVREYFDGVATDKNGGFIEALNGKPARNRPGYSAEQPDYLKLRDSKGNLVTCYSCHQTSQTLNGRKRAIVTCDHCAQHWHLDCLDPPLANPPALNQNGLKAHDWMCPLHADQEMRRVPVAQLNSRMIHMRKPKRANITETALRRGHQNNGIIEIQDDESDISDSEFYDQELEGGVIYKLPTSGIKLDFIDKVKSTRVQEIRNEHVSKRLRTSSTPQLGALDQANFAKRPFNEQQVALNLAQLANESDDLDLGADRVQNLVGTLIAEAPAEVVEEMMAADVEKTRSASSVIPPSPPSSEQTESISAAQRKELEMLQELIRRKLEGSKS